MPFLLVILPAFWLMYLVAHVVSALMAAILSFLPLGVSLFIHDYAIVLAVLGILMALFGNHCQLSEMLRNKNTPRDVLFMFSGSVIVLMVFLTLPHWPVFVGKSIFAALTLFYPSSCFGRTIMNRTDTVFSSIILVILSLLGIAALTWLVVF